MPKSHLKILVAYHPKMTSDYLDYLNANIDWVIDNSEKPVDFSGFHGRVLLNQNRGGIAGALNLAAQNACAEGYVWMVTLDQDSIWDLSVEEGVLKYIKDSHKQNIAIASPFHSIDGLNNLPPKEDVSFPRVTMTSGNFLNLKAWEELGGFREEFFIDGVDLDFCLKAWAKQWSIVQVNKCVLQHFLGNSTLMTKSWLKSEWMVSHHSPLRRYFITRNSFILLKEFGRTFPDFANFIRIQLREDLKTILLFEKQKIKKLFMMIKGWWHAKRNRLTF